MELPVCQKQGCIPGFHHSARYELDGRLHGDMLSEHLTNCATASRWGSTRHQESIDCIQVDKRINIPGVQHLLKEFVEVFW